MHLGNAWTFLLTWLSVRSQNGRLVLRVEDIDPQRSKAPFTEALLEDLRWLGLDWDEGPDGYTQKTSCLQSRRTFFYEEAIARLEDAGFIYPCFCTRSELRNLGSAPHVEDFGAPYPGTCRTLTKEKQSELFKAGRKAALRLRCAETSVSFDDALWGRQYLELAECGGDFALRRSDGVFSYQLAVTVDDALMGITEVMRGRDILPSTPRQVVLQHLLGYPVPKHIHVPLLLDVKGEKLSKRHKSLTLRELRQKGVDAARLNGLLSQMAGINPSGRPVRPEELLPLYSLDKLPVQDIRLTNDIYRRFLS
jgi:glutamyl-tRNA synthetase